MKILIVDYLAPIGHIGYDSYHIRLIEQCCDNVCIISKKEHIHSYYIGNAKILYLPNKYFREYKLVPRSVYNRIQDLLKLIYIKKFLKKEKFDKIIFLSYDIMSSGIIKFSEECLMINHTNVDGLNFRIKRFLTKKLPQNYKFVVLADYIKENMTRILPNKEIVVIPHGLTKKYRNNKSIHKPFGINKFIYCPITSSYDHNIFHNILSDHNVQSYLRTSGITLIIKSNTNLQEYPNTFVVNKFIDEETYCDLMLGALAVFAPYDASFNNRISGVLMECIGNNVPVISSPSSACYKYARKYANYDMLVEKPSEFINTLYNIEKMEGCSFYKNIEELDALPYWKKLLS